MNVYRYWCMWLLVQAVQFVQAVTCNMLQEYERNKVFQHISTCANT
jgi:hypothetical protein